MLCFIFATLNFHISLHFWSSKAAIENAGLERVQWWGLLRFLILQRWSFCSQAAPCDRNRSAAQLRHRHPGRPQGRWNSDKLVHAHTCGHTNECMEKAKYRMAVGRCSRELYTACFKDVFKAVKFLVQPPRTGLHRAVFLNGELECLFFC